jgi:hypothetical protein
MPEEIISEIYYWNSGVCIMEGNYTEEANQKEFRDVLGTF